MAQRPSLVDRLALATLFPGDSKHTGQAHRATNATTASTDLQTHTTRAVATRSQETPTALAASCILCTQPCPRDVRCQLVLARGSASTHIGEFVHAQWPSQSWPAVGTAHAHCAHILSVFVTAHNEVRDIRSKIQDLSARLVTLDSKMRSCHMQWHNQHALPLPWSADVERAPRSYPYRKKVLAWINQGQLDTLDDLTASEVELLERAIRGIQCARTNGDPVK